MARHSIGEFEKKGVVSIWVAIVPWRQIPGDYFEEHYGREKDEPFSRFAEDFKFGFYDHDFVDTNAVTDQPKSVERLIGECSYSTSFLAAAGAAVKRHKLEQADFVFLLYDIAYPPKITKVSRSEYMAFLGSFPYDTEASSAFPFEG
jgi:hypothetical protein